MNRLNNGDKTHAIITLRYNRLADACVILHDRQVHVRKQCHAYSLG